ncbi:hypothetical protein FisN_3Lh530 [Fistulifera solaris]|uniref:Uncharacterized protein n=1 Tax=Fistulifera solaris TaxID=1519565 RepID=A0A1Z5J8J7_FISSO|nr:hypothetical protein FisN_3Lh530 [Fistulifera solaris]|eukprot:GAX10324.1 hypothetical protein FisN_3Lh530 [Fistulifera solaris]
MQTAVSPGHPMSQPLKKLRAGGTPKQDSNATDNQVDEAIAYRREQIRLLQQQREQSSVLNMARSQLAVPQLPSRGRLEVRHSDLFPTAPKSDKKLQPAATIPEGPPPKAETLARRLDASFSGENPSSRSRSAPPVRPPPPPPPPMLNKPAEGTPSVSFAPQESRPIPQPPASLPISPAKMSAVSFSEEPPAPVATPAFKSFPQNKGTPHVSKVNGGNTRFAGATPFPDKHAETPIEQVFTTKAGATPFPFETQADTPETSAPSPPDMLQENQPPKSMASANRMEILRNMKEVAKSLTTDSATSQTPELRMQKELIRAENERADALKQVAKLQDEVKQLQRRTAPSMEDIVRMADREGDAAAVKLARGQVSGRPTIGFLSPKISSPLLMSPRRRHVPTPHPKRNKQDQLLAPDRDALIRATKDTVHEYESDKATFIVRRPYGVASERELWFGAGQQTSKLYEMSADAMKASTLEVVARINADSSLLALYGEDNVRHQLADGSDWIEYKNAEDEPLGNILYIDREANEREYDLDSIYLTARTVREHYCTAIATMIFASQQMASGATEPTLPPPVVASKALGRDVGVNTDAITVEPQKENKNIEKKKTSPLPPPEEANIVLLFVGMFFDVIKTILWTIFIGLPVRILLATTVSSVTIVLLATIWMYYGDIEIGRLYSEMYSRPGLM